MMFTSKSIDAEHKDLIQDVAYDFHGKRMATCSCDQHVKVSASFSSPVPGLLVNVIFRPYGRKLSLKFHYFPSVRTEI